MNKQQNFSHKTVLNLFRKQITKQLLEASVKMLGEYVSLSGFKTKKCKFEVLDLKAFHQFIANSFPHWRRKCVSDLLMFFYVYHDLPKVQGVILTYFILHTSMLTPRNPGRIISGASVWSFVASLA